MSTTNKKERKKKERRKKEKKIMGSSRSLSKFHACWNTCPWLQGNRECRGYSQLGEQKMRVRLEEVAKKRRRRRRNLLPMVPGGWET